MSVDIAIKIASTADASAFDKVAASATAMGDTVESASSKVEGASSRLDSVASSAENLDTKSAAATGALGALASGFELVGADKYAAGLQNAALATDFASGVGQALNLILGAESLQRAKAVASAASHKAATVASSVATKAAAGAQVAFNAALAANPLGLVVAALAAVGVALVLAYKKSETFRDVVDTSFSAAKTAVSAVVDTLAKIADKVSDVVGAVRDRIAPAFDTAREKVVNSVTAMMAPITNIYDKVVALIDKLKSIKVPDINVPFLRTNTGGTGTGTGLSFSGVLPGAAASADPAEIERLLTEILARLQTPQVTVTALDVRAIVRLLRREGYIVGVPA